MKKEYEYTPLKSLPEIAAAMHQALWVEQVLRNGGGEWYTSINGNIDISNFHYRQVKQKWKPRKGDPVSPSDVNEDVAPKEHVYIAEYKGKHVCLRTEDSKPFLWDNVKEVPPETPDVQKGWVNKKHICTRKQTGYEYVHVSETPE